MGQNVRNAAEAKDLYEDSEELHLECEALKGLWTAIQSAHAWAGSVKHCSIEWQSTVFPTKAIKLIVLIAKLGASFLWVACRTMGLMMQRL